MTNSMVKKKYKCQFPECNTESQIRSKIRNKDSEYYGLHVCNRHANQERALKVKSEQTSRTEAARKEQRKDYPEFYQRWCEKAQVSTCEECGTRLKGNSTEIAHIIMKSTNNELAILDDNIIFLCFSNGCHSKFDSSLDVRKKMKCFEKSLNQYKLIRDKVKKYSSEVRFYEDLI